jgi:hypothetical protein
MIIQIKVKVFKKSFLEIFIVGTVGAVGIKVLL